MTTITKAKKKIYKKKRTYKAKAKKNTIQKPMVSLGKGFPDKLMATLKYREYISLTSTTGILQNYHFSANGLYDPNITGTGHQPMFFDQYMALYNHYHVIGSKIKVTFLNSGSAGQASAVGVYLNDDSTTLSTTYTAFSEQPNVAMKIMGIGATDDREVINYKYSAKKTFGGTVMSNNALRGSVSANPTEAVNYNVFLQTLDSLTTNTLFVWVELEYIAVFTELKDFAQS